MTMMMMMMTILMMMMMVMIMVLSMQVVYLWDVSKTKPSFTLHFKASAGIFALGTAYNVTILAVVLLNAREDPWPLRPS
jgi:hypothetical protein